MKVTSRILLFGNKGQLGREIEELARAQGSTIYGFDIDELDITVEDKVASFFAVMVEKNINVVINAAAYTAVDKAEDEPELAYAVNCIAVKNLAMMCRQYNLPLLHLSTDYVFAGDKNSPYTENDVTQPLNVYGKSKLAGEEILVETWGKHIILRVSWIFGRYGNNFVKTVLRLAQEREELQIVRDQYGCPTAAKDVARVLLTIAEQIVAGKTQWGIYNYCGMPAVTWYRFAEKVVEIGRAVAKDKANFKLKHLHKIVTTEFPTRALRPKNSELLVNKIMLDYSIDRHNWLDYLPEMIRNYYA